MSAIVLTEDQRAISTQAETWPERARSIQITDDFGYADAGAMLQGVKALMREADDVFDPAVKKAHEAHRAILAAKNSVVEPLKEAEKILKRGMAEYHAECERLRLEEQRRLQARADLAAEAERKRLEAERLSAIAAASAESAEAVAEVLAQPAEPAPVAAVVELRSRAPKMAGVSTRKVWRAEVSDLKAFVLHVAERSAEDPRVLAWIMPNVSALSVIARDTKGTGEIPGVRFVSETVVASR